MAGFLARRLLNYAVLVVVAASLAYLVAATALDPRSNYADRTPKPPPAVVDAQLTVLNLNDKTPLLQRYAVWAGGVLRGDFGKTVAGAPVNDDIKRRMGVTFRLVILGLVCGSLLGVLVGALAAVRQYGWFDRLSTGLSFLVLAVPVVVLANMLILAGAWANQHVFGRQVLLVSGEYSAGVEGLGSQVVDRLQHLVLPTISLSVGLIAVFSRYQRNMMLDVLGADFVRTARAKGLSRRRALTRHALRTAMIPVVTYFAFTFGALLTGATFTEKIFGWHGLGEQLINSIFSNDVNTVAAISLLAAVSVLCAALAADLLHAALDPRVRA
ncbi:Oligopeptide transport system permease protein OppB (TC 3.A.1.5.1) [[Actinomadura] parvosata subsp. kistnae]|uniref:Peptide ABC transporter permease n=1 Tax=[Actinomadura] parvosata subsp. kistnae TaxID=1909395 RepID=A0A1V0AI38_9ACTN|nr:ABC transporter permease [Nonomuraea sp. ATCC 55076]AQZ69894.1 peptide ABC transporter permease [Nonomuraea sp. ATCC 55076]SPL90213.1 Oligopeptide transport system permease protein OppB (TC 3.A.1.5.1) [Actinomadura parvosata subsp. kistnae]